MKSRKRKPIKKRQKLFVRPTVNLVLPEKAFVDKLVKKSRKYHKNLKERSKK